MLSTAVGCSTSPITGGRYPVVVGLPRGRQLLRVWLCYRVQQLCRVRRSFLSISSPTGISGRGLCSELGEYILLKPSYDFLKDPTEK